MKRQFIDIARSLQAAKTYRAARNFFVIFQNPFDVIKRYVFARGDYPCAIWIKTPIGRRTPIFYSFHDVRSLVVSFAKNDYFAGPETRCVVDFGANIGISGLYFLTRNEKVKGYLYEPLPRNVERLKKNLEGLEERYLLEQCAIGVTNETTTFHFEPSGRYGGINQAVAHDRSVDRPYQVEVQVRNAAEILTEILEKEGYIDILKLNIEGMETEVLQSLGPEILDRIGVISAEIFAFDGELSGFEKAKYGTNITLFINKLRMLGADSQTNPA